MKRSKKNFAALLLASSMIVSGFSSVTYAAETDMQPLTQSVAVSKGIQIQLNGKDLVLTDATPVIQDGRTFVPGRALLEALGCQLAYEQKGDAEVVTVTKEGLEISMQIGKKEATVKIGGESKEWVMDAPVFVDSNDRVMVPVRFIGEALQLEVAWDAPAETVVLVDKNALVASIGTEYTVMEKYLEYTSKLMEKPQDITGDFDLAFNMVTPDGNLPFTGKGTIEGISNNDKSDLSMQMNLDLKSLKELMTEEELADKTVSELFSQIETMKIKLAMDMPSGKIYLQAPIFSTLLQSMGGSAVALDADAWLMLDFNQMFQSADMGMSFNQLTDLVKKAEAGAFATYLKEVVSAMPIQNRYSYDAMQSTVNSFVNLFRDDNMKKEDNAYVSSYSQVAVQDGQTMKTEVKFKFMADGEAINGYQMDMTMDMGAMGKVSMDMNMGSDKKSSVALKMNVPNAMDMTVNVTEEMKDSAQTPTGAPPVGSKILSINDLMGGML